MLVRVPGNLDLYSGKGVNIVVPSTVKTGENTIVDAKYSGRYLITAIQHKLTHNEYTMIIEASKDSYLSAPSTGFDLQIPEVQTPEGTPEVVE